MNSIETQLAVLSVKGDESESINRVNERGNNLNISTRGKSHKKDKTCYRCGLIGHFGCDPNALHKARPAESVGGGIILRRFVRQNLMLVRSEWNQVTPSMTMHSESVRETSQN